MYQTGQDCCYDSDGLLIPCRGSGQDGECRFGAAWPSPRFEVKAEIVRDDLTGLIWTKNANPNEYPTTWQNAFDQISNWNKDSFLGFNDWRLPTRTELRSLMSYQAKNPSLPESHPFTHVFSGWYWTSTTAAINPAYAWYIHLEGARMFYGNKEQYYLFWPVRGTPNDELSWPGCHASIGKELPCKGSGRNGDNRLGSSRLKPRFQIKKGFAHDRLTGLNWTLDADVTHEPVTWQQALDAVKHLNAICWQGIKTWRLPNINELESLVDFTTHAPALPLSHPFSELQEGYWSSTTSYFETDWAWVLYLEKGACGVGHKPGTFFYVWPVYGTNPL
jgi:hypothetical protein